MMCYEVWGWLARRGDAAARRWCCHCWPLKGAVGSDLRATQTSLISSCRLNPAWPGLAGKEGMWRVQQRAKSTPTCFLQVVRRACVCGGGGRGGAFACCQPRRLPSLQTAGAAQRRRPGRLGAGWAGAGCRLAWCWQQWGGRQQRLPSARKGGGGGGVVSGHSLRSGHQAPGQRVPQQLERLAARQVAPEDAALLGHHCSGQRLSRGAARG